MSTWKGKHGPILIAEIGGNHEGDFEYAKKLTLLAIEANVDYIKYQIYTGDTLVNPIENPVRNKHFKKFELSLEQYEELHHMCNDAGVKFLASVWDMSKLVWSNRHMDIFKIGSGDMTAYPIIKQICALGKPIIISTGLSTAEEVTDCINFIRECNPIYADSEYLNVMQCTSMYPIEKKHSNLAVMLSYKKTHNVSIGYSDHTTDSEAMEVAVAMGAETLEFHFTDTRENQTFRDHLVSLTRDEVLLLIEKIRRVTILKGSNIKKPLEIEAEHRVSFRRAAYPSRDLKAGTTVEEDDLVYLRPCHGIEASEYRKILGLKLKRDVVKYQKLNWELFE